MPIYTPKSDPSEFVSQLNADLRASGDWAWDDIEHEDGSYSEEMFWSPTGLASREVHFRLDWTAKRHFKLLEYTQVGDDDPDILENVCTLLVRADCRAANIERTEYVTRHRFAYIGQNLGGAYQLGAVRIAPEIFPDSPGVMVERVVDISVPKKGVDFADAQSQTTEVAVVMAGFLSVVLRVGLYRIIREDRWTLNGRESLGFPEAAASTGEPSEGEWAIKGFDLGRYNLMGQTGNALLLPKYSADLWLKLQGMSAPLQRRFHRASWLFQTGCTLARRFPSVQMAYHVSAVEALEARSRRNREVFHNLIQDYCTEEWEFVKKHELYGRIRSAHLHSGNFSGGEFDSYPDYPLSGHTRKRQSPWIPIRVRAISSTVLLRWIEAKSVPDIA